MSGPGRSAAVRFGALQAASFVGLGVSLPFFPVWLEGRGLTAPEIGLILALPPLVRIIASAPLMSLVDKGLEPRSLLIRANLGVALAYASLAFVRDPWLIGALVILSAVANASIIPSTDLVTLQAVRRNPRLDYGRLRLWGSLSFLAANVTAGYLFNVAAIDFVVGLLAALAIVGVAIAWRAVPRVPAAIPIGPALGTNASAPPRLPAGLWAVIAAAALIQASHSAVHGFGSIHWRDLGYSSTVIGYLWAIGVGAEIIVFASFGRHLGRTSVALGFLAAGAVSAIVRFGAMSLDPGLPATFALQALHGLSFGASHLGTMAALTLLAPEGARGRAQGSLSSVQALAAAAATALSGIVFRAAGPAVFLAMVPLATGGLVLVLASARLVRAQPQSEGGGG